MLVRSVIVEIAGMVESKGPQRFIFCFGPMESSVNHHGSCSGDEDSDGALGNSILPFSTNTRETELLLLVDNLLGKSFALVDAIVSMIFRHGDTIVTGHSLKDYLGIDRVGSI